MFKGLTNLGSWLRQAQQMGGKMQEINRQLASQRAEGRAGGGMVVVEMNGLAQVLRVAIDPQLFERNEREMVEDLLVAAFNEATAKSKQLHAEALQSLTAGIDLPGLEDAMQRIMGTGPAGEPTGGE